jgi:hypothetical protein
MFTPPQPIVCGWGVAYLKIFSPGILMPGLSYDVACSSIPQIPFCKLRLAPAAFCSDKLSFCEAVPQFCTLHFNFLFSSAASGSTSNLAKKAPAAIERNQSKPWVVLLLEPIFLKKFLLLTL